MVAHWPLVRRGKKPEEMTEEEFKKWIKQLDADGDGKISKEELRAALEKMGKWFCTWKAGRGLRHADNNGNGYIDTDEIDNLIDYAKNNWGIKIVA